MTMIRALHACALFCLFVFDIAPALADPLQSEAEALQARIDQVADALADDPRFKTQSREQRRALAQFVTGNMFFVLLHEMGHVHITEMGLPVLGREEDAADTFATVTMLRYGSAVTHRMLVEAAKGWFLSARRNEKEGITLAFYDDHGLDSQRAYWIVCLMVGSDPEKFADLAEEVHLPEMQRQTCVGDYSNASWSWNKVLEPHRRAPDEPKTTIDVIYDKDEDKTQIHAQSLRMVRLLETVAEHASSDWVWRTPFTLKAQSCGEPGSHWDLPSRTLTVCYEMAADFVRLYREYASDPVLPRLKVR
jgi:hypothetical protein